MKGQRCGAKKENLQLKCKYVVAVCGIFSAGWWCRFCCFCRDVQQHVLNPKTYQVTSSSHFSSSEKDSMMSDQRYFVELTWMIPLPNKLRRVEMKRWAGLAPVTHKVEIWLQKDRKRLEEERGECTVFKKNN